MNVINFSYHVDKKMDCHKVKPVDVYIVSFRV